MTGRGSVSLLRSGTRRRPRVTRLLAGVLQLAAVVGVSAALAVDVAGAAAGGAQQSEPSATYEVTFTLVDSVETTPGQLAIAAKVSTGPIEFVGACDGVGACIMKSVFPGSNWTIARLEGVPLTPEGDGSYSTEQVMPYSDSPTLSHCGMQITKSMSVTFAEDDVTGTYSHVPESGGVVVDPAQPGNTCYEPTLRYTLAGTLTLDDASDSDVNDASGSDADDVSESDATAPTSAAGSGNTIEADSANGGSDLILGGGVAVAATGALVGAGVVLKRRKARPRSSQRIVVPRVQPTVEPVHDPGRQTVTLSGPSTVVGISAVADLEPQVTITSTDTDGSTIGHDGGSSARIHDDF